MGVESSLALPYFSIETEREWQQARDASPPESNIKPMPQAKGENYLLEWSIHLEDGAPYPPGATFVEPQLQVYGGGGEYVDEEIYFKYPSDAGLVMSWEPTGPPVDAEYTSRLGVRLRTGPGPAQQHHTDNGMASAIWYDRHPGQRHFVRHC